MKETKKEKYYIRKCKKCDMQWCKSKTCLQCGGELELIWEGYKINYVSVR